MKTVVVNKNGELEIVNIPKPRYGPKQALTKTLANGICGTDVHLIKRKFKGFPESMYPIMLGHENVGEVIEIGSEVKGLKVGDKVFLPFVDSDKDNIGPYESGWGGSSEYGVVTDPLAFPTGEAPSTALAQSIVPSDIDPIDAVMIITLREVLSNVKYFGIRKGDLAAAIFGCGPVGITFIKILKLIGVKDVIAIDVDKTKCDSAVSNGADLFIDSSSQNIERVIRSKYPEGIPYVIDAVGFESIVNQAMGIICDRGKICCYGVHQKEEMTIDFSKASYNWTIVFQQMPRKDQEAAATDQIIKWIREGKINLKDFISDYFSFGDALNAYECALNKKIMKKGIIVY